MFTSQFHSDSLQKLYFILFIYFFTYLVLPVSFEEFKELKGDFEVLSLGNILTNGHYLKNGKYHIW